MLIIECQTVSVEDAGKILGYSRNTAYEAVKSGEIPAIRIGRKLRVPKAALERLLQGTNSTRPENR
jgi:excisionase family DNA binding protein